MNCIFGFSLFLLLLVALNIYFFYTLSTDRKPASFNLPLVKSEPIPRIVRLINDFSEHLNHLPSQYYIKNSKFLLVQRNLISSFNSSGQNTDNVWNSIDKVSSENFWPVQ